MSNRKPFGFVHDINAIYFTFRGHNWFYTTKSYSDSYTKKAGWHFDGQVFYRKVS